MAARLRLAPAGTAFEATSGDRSERFHGDRSHPRGGVSLTIAGE
jgi:hypothetical protein